MAYATTKDLARRFRSLTPAEDERAEALLEDASAILDEMGLCEADDALLRIVTCNMVRRAMTTEGDAFGLDGQTSPSEGWADSLPVGELYPLRREVGWLRGGSRICTIPMADLNG